MNFASSASSKKLQLGAACTVAAVAMQDAPVAQGKVRSMTMTYACPIAMLGVSAFLLFGATVGVLLAKLVGH